MRVHNAAVIQLNLTNLNHNLIKWIQCDLSYLSVLQQQQVLGQEHQSSGGQVFHHVNGLGLQQTDRNRRQLLSQRLQLHDSS